MRIGLIGSGHIGGTLAHLAVAAGHEVVVSNSRGPDTLADLVAELGAGATAGTALDAATFGELVIVTIPLKNYRDVPVEPLIGKVVVDTNNYYPSRDGQFPELDEDTTTSSELLAAHLPASRIVKCFNTIYYENLAKQGLPADDPDRLNLPIAGDDADAKVIVTKFLDTIGFGAVDAGALVEGRRFQPGTAAYVGGLPVTELRGVLGLA